MIFKEEFKFSIVFPILNHVRRSRLQSVTSERMALKQLGLSHGCPTKQSI